MCTEGISWTDVSSSLPPLLATWLPQKTSTDNQESLLKNVGWDPGILLWEDRTTQNQTDTPHNTLWISFAGAQGAVQGGRNGELDFYELPSR